MAHEIFQRRIMKIIIFICCFWYVSADWATPALRLTPSPKCVGVFCLGMHGGQHLEKLVFLGLGLPLVRRRVSDENVNTGLPWEQHIRICICSLSAVKQRTHNQRTFHWWRGVGAGSERAGRPGRREGGREEGSGERSYLRFHVLLQPPQFADKGCRCQGD